MKHMSKHAVVEHVVSHHSPSHRTDSPSIPIRISLIWAWQICSPDGPYNPEIGSKKHASIFRRGAPLMSESHFPFLADQIVLTGTSKDHFSALSGLRLNRPKKMSFSMWLDKKEKEKKKDCFRQLHGKSVLQVTFVFFLYAPLHSFLKYLQKIYWDHYSLPFAVWPT